MASFHFPAQWSFSPWLNQPAYQKCKRTPWHVEMKTAKSRSSITECACSYKKSQKWTVCPYPTFSCTVCDGKKGRQCTLQASSWSQQVWQPSYTVRQKQYHALCQVCVCVHRCCLEETKKKKSVADMLATAKCAALTRSRLVRQVSSVLPLTAGKMGMAPWANLRGSFTTRDNVHVACLHHSHPSFPRHSKKPWHPPTHMKNNDQAKSTH